MLQEQFIVNEKELALHRGRPVWWRFNVSRGEEIAGMLTGSDNFDFLLVDEPGFAAWHRDEASTPIDRGTGKGWHFSKFARNRDTWYACLWTNALLSPIKVNVEIRRVSG